MAVETTVRSKTFIIVPRYSRDTHCVCCKNGVHVVALDGPHMAEDWLYNTIHELVKYGGRITVTISAQGRGDGN